MLGKSERGAIQIARAVKWHRPLATEAVAA